MRRCSGLSVVSLGLHLRSFTGASFRFSMNLSVGGSLNKRCRPPDFNKSPDTLPARTETSTVNCVLGSQHTC